MRTNGKTPLVIFSLNNPALLENVAAPISTGRGCFEGQEEVAYAMELRHFDHNFRHLLAEDGQKCVLLLDNQYNAWLSFGPEYLGYSGGIVAGKCLYAGEFKEVDQHVALKSEGWSEFLGRYYVAG